MSEADKELGIETKNRSLRLSYELWLSVFEHGRSSWWAISTLYMKLAILVCAQSFKFLVVVQDLIVRFS